LAKNIIYSAHGSFVILTKSALDLLYPLYNERMFLLGEEEHLAKQADKKNVKTYYEPNIEILHKEDGSMKLLNKKVFELERQSYMEYFLYWKK
jgi:GT2 family glycosyltransferase